jgi:anti-sigma regulatory factor (Ser/Thr protein kinase)
MRELALHILDIARNSIEAGATDIEVELVEKRRADAVEFTVRDNGPGMPPDQAAKASDPFYSTRTSRRVGLGIALLKAACERTDGSFEIRSKPGEGTTVRGRMRLRHLDRPPLGNMAKVIQALACEAGRASLRYRHRANGRTFEIDTDKLQRQFGEVPLTDPRVLCWLAEFVKNAILHIGSTA